MSLVDLALNAFSGGALGLVGTGLSLVKSFVDAKNKQAEMKLEFDHELALLDKQSQLKVVEAESEMKVTQSAADAAIKSKSYEVFVDTSNVYKWAATTIALMRPFITIMLWMMTAWIAWDVTHMRGATIIDGRDLMADIVNNVTFCASAATLWWFGERAQQKGKQ